MALTVQQLIYNLAKPVTADPDEAVEIALDRMFKHDYSQLPVVVGAGQNAQFYLVTLDSILGRMRAYGVSVAKPAMLVREALVKVNHVYFQEDDLFELLQGLKDMPAVLVKNEAGELTNIITAYDTSLYFRQWSEDLMRAREIEESLKRYINASFKMSNGEIDEVLRQKAVDDVALPSRQMQKKFELALSQYLKLQGEGAVHLNEEWLNDGFLELIKGTSNITLNSPTTDATAESELIAATRELRMRFGSGLQCYLGKRSKIDAKLDNNLLQLAFVYFSDAKEEPVAFSDLTLAQYIFLFLHSRCWDRCAPIFGKDKATVVFMLEGVRKTRNKLAHFHEDEVTATDRLQLKACEELLKEKEKSALVEFEKTAPAPKVATLDKEEFGNPVTNERTAPILPSGENG